MNAKSLRFISILLIIIFLLAGCGTKTPKGDYVIPTSIPTQPKPTIVPPTMVPPTAIPPEVEPTKPQFQIPEIVTGKFNVAIVLIGFHADG